MVKQTKVIVEAADKWKPGTLLKQRRIQAAILSAVAVVSVVLGMPEVAAVCTTIAGALGFDSYRAPKQ